MGKIGHYMDADIQVPLSQGLTLSVNEKLQERHSKTLIRVSPSLELLISQSESIILS